MPKKEKKIKEKKIIEVDGSELVVVPSDAKKVIFGGEERDVKQYLYGVEREEVVIGEDHVIVKASDGVISTIILS